MLQLQPVDHLYLNMLCSQIKIQQSQLQFIISFQAFH